MPYSAARPVRLAALRLTRSPDLDRLHFPVLPAWAVRRTAPNFAQVYFPVPAEVVPYSAQAYSPAPVGTVPYSAARPVRLAALRLTRSPDLDRLRFPVLPAWTGQWTAPSFARACFPVPAEVVPYSAQAYSLVPVGTVPYSATCLVLRLARLPDLDRLRFPVLPAWTRQ